MLHRVDLAQEGAIDYDDWVSDVINLSALKEDLEFQPFKNHFLALNASEIPDEFCTLYLLHGIKQNLDRLTMYANETLTYFNNPVGLASHLYFLELNINENLKDKEIVYSYYQRIFRYLEQHPELLKEEIIPGLVEQQVFNVM